MKIFVIHGRPDLFRAGMVEIHHKDFPAIPAQLIEVPFEQPGKVFLKYGIIQRIRLMDNQWLMSQFLCMQQVFLPLLDPDILTYGIEVGAEFAREFQFTGPDPFEYYDHGFLENILRMLPVPLVVYHKSFYHWEIYLVDILQDGGIVLPDPGN